MHKLLEREKIRFLMTGFFNTGFDFVLLNCLVFLFGAYPLIANTISVTIGITISYVLNHRFVFRDKEKLSIRKYLTFFAVTGFSSLIIQNTIIYAFEVAGNAQFGHGIPIIDFVMSTDALRLNIAKASAVLIGMVWNFTFYKLVIFKKREGDEAKPASSNDEERLI